jgi:type II secretory pathway pseudopilin PulG
MAKAATRPGERGALMVALMAAIAIMMILSAVAVREWSQVVRRDNEAEMLFRAQDLVRGLRRFQKDKGRLPNELKELAEAGSKGQYFVRQLWKDPLVKGGKWQLLFAGPQGGLLDPSLTPEAGQEGTGGTGSPFGGDEGPGGLRSVGSRKGAPSPGGTINPATGEVSGLPIAGVKTKCTDQPFRVYKQKTQYSEWVFSVFDLDAQQGAAPGVPNPGAPNPGAPRPGGGAGGSPFSTPPPRN